MTDISAKFDELEQELELASLIATTLNLGIRPCDINRDAPLFNEGLGLDSIDILEVALAISRVYGFRLRSDNKDNEKIFSSLRSLNRHVQTHRSK
jgi:acyl carrier protein